MAMKEEKKNRQKYPIFQKRFHQLRGELSQEEFAKKIGVSRPVIGFYENGERVPDALTLQKIAYKCDVSIDWLLGLSNTKSGNADNIAIEKRLGLSEDAIRTLERLSTPTKNLEARHRFGAIPNAEWEQISTNPTLNEIYLRDKHILEMLNSLLSMRRPFDKDSEETHGEYILYALYEYFYLRSDNNLAKAYAMATIHEDLMTFGKSLNKEDEANKL